MEIMQIIPIFAKYFIKHPQKHHFLHINSFYLKYPNEKNPTNCRHRFWGNGSTSECTEHSVPLRFRTFTRQEPHNTPICYNHCRNVQARPLGKYFLFHRPRLLQPWYGWSLLGNSARIQREQKQAVGCTRGV